MRVGKKYVTGDFLADMFVKIFETNIATAVTSVTISNLDGNADEEYRLVFRIVSGANLSGFNLRPNNDSGVNYGYQKIRALGTSVTAERSISDSFEFHTQGNDANTMVFSDGILYAKSGYVRTLINFFAEEVSGMTVLYLSIFGQVWNNTIDNITSLTVVADQTNGLGVGTSIELYAKREKS